MTRHLNETALDWIRLAVSEECPHESPKRIEEIADMIHSLAQDWDIPVDECIRWIHSNAFDDSAPAWVRHCQWYADFRRRNCSSVEG